MDAEEETLNPMVLITTCWKCILSISLWFNLVSTPLIILWPEISDNSESKTMYYLLWLNELLFLLDMIRKFFDPPKGSRATDVYEIAVNYMKSTLILDASATVPQVASGLNNSFLWFKIIRLYDYNLLHYIFEALVHALI